jgi:hypothetical protein
MYDPIEKTIKYPAPGRDPDTGEPVKCWVGWGPDLDYWFFDGKSPARTGFRYLYDMYRLARQWHALDDLAVFQAMRRAENDYLIATNPGSAATEEFKALNDGRRLPAAV